MRADCIPVPYGGKLSTGVQEEFLAPLVVIVRLNQCDLGLAGLNHVTLN